MRWRDPTNNGTAEYEELQRVAGRAKRLARQHETATVIIDGAGRYYALRGVAEIVGVYDGKIEVGQLLEDLNITPVEKG